MFAPEVISRNISAIERKTGFTLKDHSVAECSQVYEYFRGLERTDGHKRWYERGSAFQYLGWEPEWISNELYMCSASFPYFFYRYIFIQHTDGRVARPDLHISQQMMLDILADLDRKNLPILMLTLKARQLGISTWHLAVILWKAMYRRGSHCVLASAEEKKSEELCDKVWLALDNLPLWMLPTLTGEDRKRGPEFGGNASDILIQHGSMTKGISRGSTPVAALVSEVPYYPNPVETIESSLFKAMHENPNTYLILEGTARKKGDWYHRFWMANREGEDTGYNRFTCIFLPWYVGRDKYPTSDWIRNHPVPEGWEPRRETLKQAVDARLYVSSTSLLSKHLGAQWEMSREQQWWFEMNFVEASRSDATLKSFRAELASDERSAFQSTRWSVFHQETLERIELALPDKWQDYAVTGDGIDPKFHLRSHQSSSARRIDIAWITMDGKTLNWRLVPLKETPDDPSLQFYLRVWEKPKPGYEYTIGIDIPAGIGQNRTVFDVLRKGKTIDDPDIQVAQLVSPWISSPESPAFASCLGIWYGQFMSPTKEAKMCPETQVATGDPISFQLAEKGYTNFHYFDRYDQRKTPGHQSRRRGWATNAWSRPMMMEAYKQAIDSGWVVINSSETLDELRNLEAYELESGKTKYEHADEEYDDCYMAGAIAYFCSHDKETIMDRMTAGKRPRPLKEIDPATSVPDTLQARMSRFFEREDRRFAGSEDEAEPREFMY